jgi:hypothetical protein
MPLLSGKLTRARADVRQTDFDSPLVEPKVNSIVSFRRAREFRAA